MTGTKYPCKYPSGKGSSHQYVMGCGPVPDLESMKTLLVARNMSKYFWKVELWGKESVSFTWEDVRVVQTRDKISMLNWRHFTEQSQCQCGCAHVPQQARGHRLHPVCYIFGTS